MKTQQVHQQTSTNKQAQVIVCTDPINHISNPVHIDCHVDIAVFCFVIAQRVM